MWLFQFLFDEILISTYLAPKFIFDFMHFHPLLLFSCGGLVQMPRQTHIFSRAFAGSFYGGCLFRSHEDFTICDLFLSDGYRMAAFGITGFGLEPEGGHSVLFQNGFYGFHGEATDGVPENFTTFVFVV